MKESVMDSCALLSALTFVYWLGSVCLKKVRAASEKCVVPPPVEEKRRITTEDAFPVVQALLRFNDDFKRLPIYKSNCSGTHVLGYKLAETGTKETWSLSHSIRTFSRLPADCFVSVKWDCNVGKLAERPDIPLDKIGFYKFPTGQVEVIICGQGYDPYSMLIITAANPDDFMKLYRRLFPSTEVSEQVVS